MNVKKLPIQILKFPHNENEKSLCLDKFNNILSPELSEVFTLLLGCGVFDWHILDIHYVELSRYLDLSSLLKKNVQLPLQLLQFKQKKTKIMCWYYRECVVSTLTLLIHLWLPECLDNVCPDEKLAEPWSRKLWTLLLAVFASESTSLIGVSILSKQFACLTKKKFCLYCALKA